MQYVGVGRRFLAVLIDSIILGIVGYIIALITGGTTSAGFSLSGAPAGLLFLIGLAYFTYFEANSGATLGKQLLGIQVVRADGASPIGYGPAVIRNLLRIIDGLFVYLVGAILIWTSPTRQRLGDRAAGTVVVPRATVPARAEA